MSKKEITIKDVAKLANCSPTTVSRVINNSDHPVSKDTADRVKEVIDKLNYSPNRIAQGLKSDKSNIIGVIVHDICDSYFAQMVKGIEEFISGHEYIVNIYNTGRSVEKELYAFNLLKANRADAIILAGGALMDSEYEQKMYSMLEQLKNQNTLVIGITPHPFDIKNIILGNDKAIEEITDKVIDYGHKKIAYIGGPKKLYTSYLRRQGFEKSLKKNNIILKENLIFDGDFSFEGGRKAALEIIKNIDDITAIVASNDSTALGAMWELNNQNIMVPEKISIVGINDLPEAKYSYPPLTTMEIPIYQLGTNIAEYLLNKFNKNYDYKFKDIETELVIRNSLIKI